MSRTIIESDANPRMKRWRKLAKEARAVKREGATLIEGIHLAESALENPKIAVDAVLLSEKTATDEALDLAEALMREKDARVYVLADRLYDELAPVEHGVGIMCEMPVPKTDALDFGSADVLYLDGIQDAGNAGTLIRTAVAAGFRTIAASPGTAQLWAPKVLRAGMGAHFGARIFEGVTPEAFRGAFKGQILAADARGGENLFTAPMATDGPVAWIMGAEGPGVSDAALAVADARRLIPIEAACESLNVGAAAAVCLFETRRRRMI